MFHVSIHGRSGQGVMMASQLLTQAATLDGRHLRTQPAFETQQTAAETISHCQFPQLRGPDRPVLNAPHAVIFLSDALLGTADAAADVGEDGWALVNTRQSPTAVRGIDSCLPLAPGRLATVPGDDIARVYLGRSIPAAAMVGAFAALTGQLSLPAIIDVIAATYRGAVAVGNARSAQVAYAWVLDHRDTPDVGSPVGGYPFRLPEELGRDGVYTAD